MHLHTWSTELTHRGEPGVVIDTAVNTTFRHTPLSCAHPAVPVLGCIVDFNMRCSLRQVFAVMTEAVLGDLDGVEVALRPPLSRQRDTWVTKRDEQRLIQMTPWSIQNRR